jgi:hypothetical protein
MPTGFTHDDAATAEGLHYRDLQADKSRYRDRSVLLLGRDLRDTLVSAYFHTSRRMGAYRGTISEFIRDERHGAIKVISFYRNWHAARDTPRRLLFMRYEEMHRDPGAALAAAMRFLGAKSIDPAAISAAVEFATFENLRKAEAENRYPDGTMTPVDPSDPETYKFRRGKAGGYTDYLSADDVAYIDDLNARLGCEFTR